ncbi:QA-SNARE protein [Strigomonas culicis]|uniref:QA-SNARE protein n=1 Tax=Strigomonas culicis TaxID=28005 RepID=S9WIG2_9TRYP|nr:QA-SNARE protein [Strigomonas culicis]|eukprot:EPY35640.1 QA-SNARE protein [Strigomonas culicis]
MDGFELAEADLDATLQQLHQVVTSVIEATMLTEKKRIEMTARPILREARRKLSALRAEARRTADPGTRARYEEKCRAKDDRIRNYDGEMKSQIFPSQNASRPKAYQEQREEEMMGEGGVDGTGFKSSKQVLSAAINVQADALQSLQRTERLQNVTEEQGKATLQELQKQTEKMYQVDERLENLQGELDHAMRDVRWFYRQVARDKCCMSLFGLVILAIVALVFISIWTKRKKSASSS